MAANSSGVVGFGDLEIELANITEPNGEHELNASKGKAVDEVDTHGVGVLRRFGLQVHDVGRFPGPKVTLFPASAINVSAGCSCRGACPSSARVT